MGNRKPTRQTKTKKARQVSAEDLARLRNLIARESAARGELQAAQERVRAASESLDLFQELLEERYGIADGDTVAIDGTITPKEDEDA